MRMRTRFMLASIAMAFAATTAPAQSPFVINLDYQRGFRYPGTNSSDPAPVPGQMVTPYTINSASVAQYSFLAGSYRIQNAWALGSPGALYKSWNYQVSANNWQWAFLAVNAADNKVINYWRVSDTYSSADAVAARPEVQNFDVTLTFLQPTNVIFTFRDYYADDNAGGVSLLVTPPTPPTNPAVVPEPSTWALLATGLAGLMAIRRRRASGSSGPRA